MRGGCTDEFSVGKNKLNQNTTKLHLHDMGQHQILKTPPKSRSCIYHTQRCRQLLLVRVRGCHSSCGDRRSLRVEVCALVRPFEKQRAGSGFLSEVKTSIHFTAWFTNHFVVEIMYTEVLVGFNIIYYKVLRIYTRFQRLRKSDSFEKEVHIRVLHDVALDSPAAARLLQLN